MTDETKKLVVGTAMRDMFQKGWLNICTIDKCLEISGLLRGGDDYRLLGALHCINFKDMPPELFQRIPNMLKVVFSGLSVDDLMQACLPPAKQSKMGFMAKLIN